MSSSSDECASDSNAIISSVMSWSVKFLLVVTAKCTSTQLDTTETQHFLTDRDSSIGIAWPVACYWSDKEQAQVFS